MRRCVKQKGEIIIEGEKHTACVSENVKTVLFFRLNRPSPQARTFKHNFYALFFLGKKVICVFFLS